MTIQELLTRLDTETDGVGNALREQMQGDPSPVEDITVDYELLEGGEAEDGSEDTYVIKEFFVWTQDFVYHSESDEYAFLYEDGRVYKVPRNPEVKTKRLIFKRVSN